VEGDREKVASFFSPPSLSSKGQRKEQFSFWGAHEEGDRERVSKK
jgi:hypothetical protein